MVVNKSSLIYFYCNVPLLESHTPAITGLPTPINTLFSVCLLNIDIKKGTASRAAGVLPIHDLV